MSADPVAIQALFVRAIECADLTEREELLANECAGNVELYERVTRLLVAFESDKGFLDQPTNNLVGPNLDATSGFQPGDIVASRYKLLESIGEGGMGTVWVAEQIKPIRRKVALKLVKPGMDSKQVLARFDAERQALALMDHPNIAKVFDGGVTDQGRPYFAMEYVKGMPLTEYCDQLRLSVADRLKLFVPICQAVQHAHQKGIIHRDLKPSNVLICLYDGKPVPKVIDFGLAKAMHQPLTEQTVHTGHGLMIGTPLYMSPEQAEHNNLDVDTRTDVYSLGVMLYELLTGSTPLEKAKFKDAAFGEILRLIKEVEPPRPSTRVSSSAQLPSIAAQRSLDPIQLGRSIRGDLDWIVMKAIEKERDRRYETANGLARDIERFLNLEVVEACPPSTGYRLRRMFRKHRAAIASATAFAAILLLGASLSFWQAVRATSAESLASQRLVDVQAEQIKTKAALDASLKNETRALTSESVAVTAREAEKQAKLAEAEQRELAEQQRDEAQRLQMEAAAKSTELLVLTEQQRKVIYASDMNQVRIEAQRGNLARMREILLSQLPIDGKPDLRGIEWNYWYRYLNQAEPVRKFESAKVDAGGSALVAVLPGGQQVAWSRGSDTTVVDLTDGSSRTFPFELRNYGDRTPFSYSSRAVVGAYDSQVAYQRRKANDAPTAVDDGSQTSCSVFDPSGEQHTIKYPLETFCGISHLSISSDGHLVAVLGNDVSHTPQQPVAHICVWNIDSKALLLNESYQREINRVSFSPDGRLIAAYLCHGSLQNLDTQRDVAVIIDVATGIETAVAQHDDDIEEAFWLPDSNHLLLSTLGFSGANRKQLLTWDLKDFSRQPILLTKEPMDDGTIGAVSNDGHTLAITSHKAGRIRLFDTLRGDLLDTLQTGGKGITSATFSLDDRQLIATTVDAEVARWELGPRGDLFALRTKPLPALAENGYALSRDQSLVAIALADGTLLVRTRDGQETRLRESSPDTERGTALMAICPKNRYLAFRTTIGLDGKTLPRGQGVLELYDLQEQRRMWQKKCSYFPVLTRAMETGTPLAFSADGTQVVHCETSAVAVLDSRTGRGTGFQYQNDESAGFGFATVKANPLTGVLYSVLTELQHDGEARLVKFDPLSGERSNGCPIGHGMALAFAAPDGNLCSVFRPGVGVEIWNLAKQERILYVPGTVAIFSSDSKRVAIAGVTVKSLTASNTAEAHGIAVWDLEKRRRICELQLDGDLPDPDGTRFSHDGKRLLTLHGQKLTNGGRISHGRLWDVETGHEILDIPVTDVNHYVWNVFFDASGEQLTALVFNKAAGTIGGGSSAVFDVRPLDVSVDCELIADRMMHGLQTTFALKREWTAQVESLAGLREDVRAAVLNRIRTTDVLADQIARMTREIVSMQFLTLQEYQRAVAWAEELKRLEPNTLRSRTLLGAAYFRAARFDEALALLTHAESNSGSADSEVDQDYERIRLAALALVYMNRGDANAAYETLKGTSRSAPYSEWAAILKLEAQLAIPHRLTATPQESMPSQESLKQLATRLITAYGNGSIIELERNPSILDRWRVALYDVNADNQLEVRELQEALEDNFRYGRPCAMLSRVKPELQLEFLDEAIRSAPKYLSTRFARAWIHATSPEPKFRDAKAALAEATTICEHTNYQDPTYLEALAAAYAESGDFESAIHWQSEAVRLFDIPFGIMAAEVEPDCKERLLVYQELRPMRTKSLPYFYDIMSFLQVERQATQDASAPLLSPDDVSRSRRIAGWGAAWSPDGKKMVRSLKYNDPLAPLEILDLESGATREICLGGVDPVWMATPQERIYFVKGPEGELRSPINESVWQFQLTGENLSKLTDGGYPSLAQDDRMFVRQLGSAGRKMFLKSLQFDENGDAVDLGFEFLMPAYYPPVSPSGKLVAISTIANARLRIINVESGEEIQSIVTNSLGDIVLGGWSPDSRYVAYGNTNSKFAGLWLLDVATGEQRLLADVQACNPRWSPDGRYIAADERDNSEIVILDVGSLNLNEGFGGSSNSSVDTRSSSGRCK